VLPPVRARKASAVAVADYKPHPRMEPPRKKTKKTQKTRTLLELPTDVFLLIVDRLCSEDLLACRLVHSQVNQVRKRRGNEGQGESDQSRN
jgi:hypothetical protein